MVPPVVPGKKKPLSRAQVMNFQLRRQWAIANDTVLDPAVRQRLLAEVEENMRGTRGTKTLPEWNVTVANRRRVAANIDRENRERQNREHAAFLRWRALQAQKQQAEVDAGVPAPPPVDTPAFQAWMKQLFTAQRGAGTRPSLLRYMRTPPGKTAHETLAGVLSAATAATDPCKAPMRPDTAGIQAHQAVVHVMAQLRARQAIATSGLLVMHSTGAGKTLSGLAIMLAFWNTGMPILLVSTNDNREANNTLKFAELGMLMFADFVDEESGQKIFAKPAGARGEYWRDAGVKAGIAAKIDARLKRGIRRLYPGGMTDTEKSRVIYTFGQMGNDLENGSLVAKDAEFVVIVDEIQFLLSPPSTEMHLAPQYALVLKMLQQGRSAAKSWCVGMTATPGETREEVVKILRAIQGPVRAPVGMADSLQTLRDKLRGYVSYAYLLGDKMRFASVRMRMLCSYLEDADTKKRGNNDNNGRTSASYYRDAYLRRLRRTFLEHPMFPDNAKRFVAGLELENSRKALQATGHMNRHFWEYGANAAKTGSFLYPLRMLTLFMKLGKEEMELLHRSLDEDENGRAGRGKRVLPELYVGTGESGAAPANAESNNENSGDSESAEDADQRYIERSRAADQRAGGRARKGRRVHRYLLSPKIPQFLSFVYKDLAETTNATPKAKASPRLSRGIHYVYTSNPTTALLLAHTLTRVLGIPQLRRAEDARGGPYFVMIDDVKSTVDILSRYRQPAFQTNLPRLKALIDSPANAFGDIVKVVIATKKSFKGVDLKHIRYLHLLDPMVNFRDFIQFVGRGPRYCSHPGHSPSNRFVEVVLYRLLLSPGHDCAQAGAALPDCFLWDQAYSRYFGQGQFNDIEDQVLWKSSVDYELFKDNLHTSRDSLKKMIDRVKCNTLKPFASDNAVDKDYKSAVLRNGFAELERHSRARTRKRLGSELQKAMQPVKMDGAQKAAFRDFKKEMKRRTEKLDRARTAHRAALVSGDTRSVDASRDAMNNLSTDLNVHRLRYPNFANTWNFERQKALLVTAANARYLDVHNVMAGPGNAVRAGPSAAASNQRPQQPASAANIGRAIARLELARNRIPVAPANGNFVTKAGAALTKQNLATLRAAYPNSARKYDNALARSAVDKNIARLKQQLASSWQAANKQLASSWQAAEAAAGKQNRSENRNTRPVNNRPAKRASSGPVNNNRPAKKAKKANSGPAKKANSGPAKKANSGPAKRASSGPVNNNRPAKKAKTANSGPAKRANSGPSSSTFVNLTGNNGIINLATSSNDNNNGRPPPSRRK